MRVITGTARGRRLKELEGMETRPTTDRVKEGIFNIIQFDLEGRRVLDLFAGTGQLGIEALSRGAVSAVFVDQRRDAADKEISDAQAARDEAMVIKATYEENMRQSKAKADALREADRRSEAMKVYAFLAATPATAEGAEAYYRLVENDYRNGNYDDAEQRVYALGECGSMYWQAKIFLILGDVLAKKGNTFQARATYQSIVDGYSPEDDGIVDEAKRRIASLAK